MWPFKKKPAKGKKTTIENRLTIKFTDKSSNSWSISDWESSGKITPWREFYKWFFSRHDSEAFTMRTKVSDLTVKRGNIHSFQVELVRRDAE